MGRKSHPSSSTISIPCSLKYSKIKDKSAVKAAAFDPLLTHIPLVSNSRYSRSGSGPRQADEMAAADVTGEQRGAHLGIERVKIRGKLTVALSMPQENCRLTHGPPGHVPPCQEVSVHRAALGSPHGLKEDGKYCQDKSRVYFNCSSNLSHAVLTQIPTASISKK